MDEAQSTAEIALADLLAQIIPFVRHIGLTFTEVAPGRGVAVISAHREIANYLGTVHAGATFTLAEAASGAAVVGLVAPILNECTSVTRHASIRYKRPADGKLIATATIAPDPSHVYEQIVREGRADVATTVDVHDASNTVVAQADIVWHVRRRTSAKGGP